MDTQLGSIKHITLQLPSFGTSALLIARFFMAMFGIGSLNLMCRLSSSVVGKTNISFSFHSLKIIQFLFFTDEKGTLNHFILKLYSMRTLKNFP